MSNSMDVDEAESLEFSDDELPEDVSDHPDDIAASMGRIKQATAYVNLIMSEISGNASMLTLKTLNSRNNECLANLVKQGWLNCSNETIESIGGTHHASLTVRDTRRNGEKTELWFCQLFMTPEWIRTMVEDVFTPSLAQKGKPSLRKPPTETEFWIFFGRLLLALVVASPSGHQLDPCFAMVKAALDGAMKEARYNLLLAAFKFDNDIFSRSLDHCMDVVLKSVRLGRILALDETIAATESKVAEKKRC